MERMFAPQRLQTAQAPAITARSRTRKVAQVRTDVTTSLHVTARNASTAYEVSPAYNEVRSVCSDCLKGVDKILQLGHDQRRAGVANAEGAG